MTQTQASGFPGLATADLTFDQAIAAVARLARQDRFSYVVTPNVDHVVALRRRPPDLRSEAFATSYADADLVLCDSRILARLAGWSGQRMSIVPGSDLTAALLDRGVLDGLTVAVIGGDEALLERLRALYPRPRFVHLDPPMGVLTDAVAQARIVDFVAEARPQVTLFAIGAPQSELVARACKRSGRAQGVGLCIGASLEFVVGHKKRAPRWMQRLSLEWAHRLLSEPRRLWRRYLVEGPAIFTIWWRDRRGAG